MSAVGQYEFLVGLLFVIVLLELAARRLRLPPAAALILGGTALALLPGVPTFSVDPDLVLAVSLPPLLMNAGYFSVWAEFRENMGGIALLAVGATVSPPDAVAVDAVLERLSLPSRLTATLEGKNLLNDASGQVLFSFAVAAALNGGFNAAT